MKKNKTTDSQILEPFFSHPEMDVKYISSDRKKELEQLAILISESIEAFGFVKLIFVCTHNSRRSQLGQVCMRAAAEYLEIDHVFTYSGGTEATAFNHRMVAAIENAGFEVEKIDEEENPKYRLHFSLKNESDELYFSKKYDHVYNPNEHFIAVMVCDQADADCPFIPGAYKRFSLPYLDPKAFDDAENEAKAYQEKVLEIGREMFYLASKLK
jgi:protein-tyrosine-phosphatase